MSLFVEIIKKRENTTAPWEVRAIQSVINFLDSPVVNIEPPPSVAEFYAPYRMYGVFSVRCFGRSAETRRL